MLTVGTSSDRAPPSVRDKKRERERLARQRRVAKLQRMRDMRDSLECAVVVSYTIDDVDAVWEDFLDDHAIRVRRLLRKSLRLTKEAQDLQLERALLVRLLAEHRLSSQILAEALEELTVDDWELNVARWRVLSRTHFTPWTLDDCQAEMEAAFKEVNAFDWSLEKETTGLAFLGWREQRRVDTERNAFWYKLHKTFHGDGMMEYVNVGWDTYTDAKTYQDIVIGCDAPNFHEVLQQIGPNIVIVWSSQQLPQIGTNVHMTFMVCRVQTDCGIIQCVRSIACPRLVEAVRGPVDMWGSTFSWQQWTRLDGDENGYKYQLGGSIIGRDMGLLKHWMLAIIECVLRGERLATGSQLLRTE